MTREERVELIRRCRKLIDPTRPRPFSVPTIDGAFVVVTTTTHEILTNMAGIPNPYDRRTAIRIIADASTCVIGYLHEEFDYEAASGEWPNEEAMSQVLATLREQMVLEDLARI